VIVAARVSQHQTKGDLDRPRHVVIATAEDDWHAVAVPRLLAAGADLDLVHFVERTRDGYPGLLSLPSDTNRLLDAVESVNAALLVVDPITAHLDAGVDSHRDAEVRTVLAALQGLAETSGAAVFVVAHLNKSQVVRALDRIGGSVAFGNAPRSVLIAHPQPHRDPKERALYHAKCNVGPEAGALGYRIEGDWAEHDARRYRTSVVCWTGDVVGTADDALGAVHRRGDDEATELDRAMTFLTEALEPGPQLARDVKRWAAEEGIKLRTLHRARDRLGVRHQREKVPRAPTYWWIPNATRATPMAVTQLAPNGPEPVAAQGESVTPCPDGTTDVAQVNDDDPTTDREEHDP
jgi:hypothetical protein